MKKIVYNILLGIGVVIIFIILNIIGLYFGDEQGPDVDGRYYGFTKEELMEDYNEVK